MAVEVQIKKRLGEFCLDVQFCGQARRIGILGASGCGKSQTLKSIAGIVTPDTGRLCMDGKVLFDSLKRVNRKPQKRNIGYLFQNYALFPTMTVAQNIAAGVKGTKEEKKKRVSKMIEKFRLTGLEGRMPDALSGGQQQRVALARIMAYEPDMILLDEPFSALDLFLKDHLQQEMAGLLAGYPGTVIMVSHNRDEIYRFCEELLVMDKGRAVIYGKTKEIFENPVYREAARLTGCKNFSDIRKTGLHTFEALDWGISVSVQGEVPEDASCIGYRAHDFVPVWGGRTKNCLKFRLADWAALPFENNYYVLPETGRKDAENICWFVQREKMSAIKQKGLPDYLQIQETSLLFLS